MSSRFLPHIAVVSILTTPLVAWAGQAPSGHVPTATQVAQPTVMRFDSKGLSLVDAVRLTLENDPAIKLTEAAHQGAQGALQAEAGLFDSALRAGGTFERTQSALTATQLDEARALRDSVPPSVRAALGEVPEDLWSRDGGVQLRFDRLTRSGLYFAPFVNLRYTASNYVGKSSTNPLEGGLGVNPLYQAQVGFDVVLPLARGRGAAAVAAGERAARYDLEASRLAMLHQRSASVLDTVLAYWEVKAAADQVDVLRRSVELQTTLGGMVRSLIAARERPRADEARVLASTAAAQARLEQAQRRLSDARLALARVMGVALADPQSLPMAADAFPASPAGLTTEVNALRTLSDSAVGQRLDRKAAASLESSGLALVDGARLDTRSLMNLSASGWGGAAHENSASLSAWTVPNARVALDYERPLGNNAAKGRQQEAEARLKQNRIQTADLSRQIGLSVTRDATALASAAQRLRWAEEAVKSYDQTIRDEQAKLKGGDSSLVDTILTEQQTTAARLELVAAQQEYASLLARLRFEAGLLVQDGAEGARITPENLTAVPAALVRR
jgi:outer membrane protein TolC